MLDDESARPSGDCAWVSGTCTLFRRNALAVDPIDTQMHAYYEDSRMVLPRAAEQRVDVLSLRGGAGAPSPSIQTGAGRSNAGTNSATRHWLYRNDRGLLPKARQGDPKSF